MVAASSGNDLQDFVASHSWANPLDRLITNQLLSVALCPQDSTSGQKLPVNSG